MKFLYPEFLYGLFTLAIPVIVHLFNFRKSKKIYFSSTRFLTNIKKSTSQKLKIKHLLILFSRLLFLTFLVFAFAQPYLPSVDKNPQAESVYIYLDNSSSMSNRVDETMTSINLGIDYVNKILDLYPENTTYKFLTNDFAPFSNTLKSKSEVAELLTELRLSTISRTLPEAYTRLKSHTLFESEKSKDLFIISDFQKSTIGNLDQFAVDTIDQVFVTPIFFEATKNIFIDSMYLSNPFLVANEKNQINIMLQNAGFEDADELPIKLFINEIQSASSMVSIPAGGSKALSFEINYNLKKVNQCRISFEDYPVTFDNDFYFVLKLENRINIMEIKSFEAISPLEKVYGNTSLFNFQSHLVSNIDYSIFRQVDLVFVNGLQTIDNSLANELNDFVDQGGALCILPDGKPDLESYKNILTSIIPLGNDTSRVEISMPDFSDPFFENIFESKDEQMDMPDALPVLNWRGQQADILRLRNNVNFLSAFRSEGIVFIMASPLDDQFTNFHQHALFVPVMYRIAAMSKKSFEKLYYEINEPIIRLRLDSLQKQDIFVLANMETELIPNQRINTNEILLEMPKNTLNPGFYNLKHGDKTDAVLAFNLEKEESYLEQLSSDEIKSNFSSYKNVTIFETNDADNLSNEVKKNKFGVPLWKYAIIISLLFLLAEVLLIRLL